MYLLRYCTNDTWHTARFTNLSALNNYLDQILEDGPVEYEVQRIA